MSEQTFSTNQLYGFLPSTIEGINSLAALALDMRWSWNHTADKLWQQLDPDLWELTNNPWVVLQTVSRDRVEQLLSDPGFRENLDSILQAKEQANTLPAWFHKKFPDVKLTAVAYFSMEFMLSDALPIYVGGLGNVAGDQLKSASDLGVPVVAIGLFYQQGYFHQEIDKNGNQLERYPYNDPGQLPITPLRLPNGEWLRLKISIAGYPVWLRTWQVQAGRVKLFLLDSNDAANLPVHRGITNELYGGGADLRMKQELILGIGGWRLLRALGIKPEVCHMNEGHAAFLVLERANDYMKETGTSFKEALMVTRSGNLFTTHTAVPAGFDHFKPSLMQQMLGSYSQEELSIDFDELMALGRWDPKDQTEDFKMAYLAIRGCGAINGVSSLHEKVSKKLFMNLFPRWPVEEVPIGHVTNGVHMPSWDSEISDKIWTQTCGKDRWRGNLGNLEEQMVAVSDETLWQMRNSSRSNLVNFTRNQFERQLSISGRSTEMLEIARQVFNPNTLTLGFARRFVPYKRPNLLLHDPERLIRILTHPTHPVQLVLAGKAAPFDEVGKALIRKWIQFINQNNLHHHVVFLDDYDMSLTENLVRGVDVWINTPKRPWEASGTSGMKVLVNGGINISSLDGWWAEAYSPDVGWAIGDEMDHGDDPIWDIKAAEELYDLLEKEVVPTFYNRDPNGIPTAWIKRMRNSMAKLTPRFSANRTVREYTGKYYLPAAEKYLRRAADNGKLGIKLIQQKLELEEKWHQLKFGIVETSGIQNGYFFKAEVYLGEIKPYEIMLELFADGIDGSAPKRIKMEPNSKNPESEGLYYQAEVITSRPADDFTARIIPNLEGLTVPLEINLIHWQR
ncbi:alpha-glucan family phosphorylase [Rhodonellum sp.]|uniref:alpha-glucan family phosphorylase n=1 Tax=Rhodonellum sp. TaxID=2231180 RepID=UPI00271FAF22|nr:alpha-glucan family phosphorylase [Rhodonellum sp.]MDO9554785.1 alpha-glucan family phosphorylase [Rhodonellum sp.]